MRREDTNVIPLHHILTETKDKKKRSNSLGNVNETLPAFLYICKSMQLVMLQAYD
jgi:hypothetical protein